MIVLDAFLVLLVTVGLVTGSRIGLLGALPAWAGLAAGLAAAVALLPHLLVSATALTPAGRLVVVLATTVAGSLGGWRIATALASRRRLISRRRPMNSADRVAGAALGVLAVLGVMWLLLPSAAAVPGWAALTVRTSLVARALDRSSPRPPVRLQYVGQLVAPEPYPLVFDKLRSPPNADRPPPDSGLSAETATRVQRSVVNIRGTGCARSSSGSGFFVGRDLVVSAAHVVAGHRRVQVSTFDGLTADAVVVGFDPDQDLAVLRVQQVSETPLGLDVTERRALGAVVGPRGLPAAPASVDRQLVTNGSDIYLARPVRREVLVLGARVGPGGSGAPLVDDSGAVAGVVFAVEPARAETVYALPAAAVGEALRRVGSNPAGTGRCPGATGR